MNSKKVLNFSRELLAQLKRYGASDAEVYISRGEARQVVVSEGALEKAENAQDNSIAVRAYVGQQTATAQFSFDPSFDYNKDLEDLVLAAKMSPEDPYAGLADPDQLAKAEPQDFDQYDATPLLDIPALKARALALEKATLGEEVVVDRAATYHNQGESFYVASNGFETERADSGAAQTVTGIHQGKELSRDYASSIKIYLSELEPVEETAKRCYERVWQARNPQKGPSGVFPVLFDERVASSLIGHLKQAMSAASIARRASWLIDYEDDVFPKNWLLLETPFRPKNQASSVVDAEGLLRQERAFVAKGRPQFWVSNLSSARQLDMPSSGNAVRSGVNTGAAIPTYRLEADFEPRDALLKSMNEGLFVTGFIGATLNPHTGDYSRGANGFWVRGGEICEAVNELTIASNLKTMLPALRAADDADEDRNAVVPSLLAQEMTIAGQ